MPTVDGSAAADTFRAMGTNTPSGCLDAVWRSFKAHGATASGWWKTAMDAFASSQADGVHHDTNPPKGAVIWLGVRNWGSNPKAGDVFVSLGDGLCAATDYPGWGTIGVCTIRERMSQTGRPYLGWTANLLGNPIRFGVPADDGDAEPFPDPKPEPEPIPEEDEMPGKILLVKTAGEKIVEVTIGDPAYGKELAQFLGDATAPGVRKELGNGRYLFRGFSVSTNADDFAAALSEYSRGDRKAHATRDGSKPDQRALYVNAQKLLSLDAVLQPS